jgi:hypothetical protein
VENDSPATGVSNPSENSAEPKEPYSAIWMRNVFDLRPPPPPADTNIVKDNTPPPNVKLTGITTIFGRKQAFFLVQPPQTPGKPAFKEESYELAEGERRGPLEVVEINPKARNVKIKNDGIESTITFETNRPPSGPAQVAGPAPGVPGPRPFPRPGGAPGMPLPISRQIRGVGANQPQNGYYPNGAVTPQAAYGGGVSPGYGGTAVNTGGGVNLGGLFNAPQSATTQQPGQPPDLPLEQQITQVLVNQAVNADKIRAGFMPPMPIPSGVPDPLQSEPGANESSSSTPTSTTPQLPSSLAPRSSGSFARPGAP